MAEMDSDEAFARALQKQLLEEAEGSNLAAQHSNYGAQSHGHGQDLIAIPGQKPPPSYSEETPQWDRESSDNNYRYGGEESLQQLLSRSEEEDSDLLLARRMQQMVDIGTYDSQQFASLAEELRQQQQSHTTSNNDNFETQPLKSRREQEEEDARLARRLMESGMSFRDLECVPGSTTPAPKPKPPPTTTTDRQSSGDSGTGYRDIQLNSGHTSNAGPSSPSRRITPTPSPRYPHPTTHEYSTTGRAPFAGNTQPYTAPYVPPQPEFNPPMGRPGISAGQHQPYTPQVAPQYNHQIPRNHGIHPTNTRQPPGEHSTVTGAPMRSPVPPPGGTIPIGGALANLDPIQLDEGPLQLNASTHRKPQYSQTHPEQAKGRMVNNPNNRFRDMASIDEPPMISGDAFLDVFAPAKKEKPKKKGFLKRLGLKDGDPSGKESGTSIPKADKPRGFFGIHRNRNRTSSSEEVDINPLPTEQNAVATVIASDPYEIHPFPHPDPVPRLPDTMGVPYSVSRDTPPHLDASVVARQPQLSRVRSVVTCVVCHQPAPNALTALDNKYHPECFRCIMCHQLIDCTGPFSFIETDNTKQPMHKDCYSEMFGIKCSVCQQLIPAGADGRVSYVKHPFFDTEKMCPKHAALKATRRCTGCHRFEPENEPFADLNDCGRCVCMSCCRSVVVDSQDAQPLWDKVVAFFRDKLDLQIWRDFEDVPILVVGHNALTDQWTNTANIHGGSSQLMTRGLCLTEHECGRRFRSNRMRFDRDSNCFLANDTEDRGFTYFQVPDASKSNPDASVTAILCLSGLPRELTASVLAHEATHAWIKLHPGFSFDRPLPPEVEEGCAQLIALLFLNDGLGPPMPLENNDGSGPSDEKLRQYFKFSIETDDHEIYGVGFQKAAAAYEKIGIEALMAHVVMYKNFPEV